MRTKYGVLVAVSCAAAMIGLSACGSDDSKDGIESKSASEISEKASAELTGAKSMRISMDQGADEMQMDLALDVDGNCSGTIAIGDQGSVVLTKLGDKVWMKPDDAFWKAKGGANGEQMAKLFKGRYIYGTSKDDMLKSMADTCDLKAMQKSIGEDDDDDAKELTKGDKATVDGQPTITIENKKEKEKVYVATKGKPYPLKIVSTDKDDGGTIELKDFDKPVPRKTPSVSESIDVAKLQEEMEDAS